MKRMDCGIREEEKKERKEAKEERKEKGKRRMIKD